MKFSVAFKRAVLIALPLILLITAVPVNTQALKTVRVSCGINFALYYDEDGNVIGQCKDYLDALATVAGWEIEYVDVTVREAISMLDSGEIDIMFPTGDLTENHEQMSFSRLPGGYTALGIFASDSSTYEYENFSEFNGARIAVLEASSHAVALEAYAEANGFEYVEIPMGTSDDIKKALASGEVNMAVGGGGDDFPGAVLVAMMDAVPFYFAVKKGNTELLDELDHAMQQLMQTDSELVANTYRKCLTGDNNVRLSFTEEEWQFIRSGAEIKVGFYEETEPLAYINEDGEYSGVYIDILEYIADTAGLNITLHPISRDVDSWREPLNSGDIDFYIGSALSVIENYDNLIATKSVIDYDIVLVTDKNSAFSEIETPVIALTNDRSYWMSGLRMDADVSYYRTPKDCLLAVAKGEADGALVNNYEFNYHMKNDRFEDLVQMENYRYAAGACLTALADVDPVKFSIVSKSLSAVTGDYVDEIVYEHINMPNTSETFSDKLYSARWILIVCGIILAFVAIIALMFRHSRVKERERQKNELRQLRILSALSRDYASIYYINFTDDEVLLVWSDDNPTPLRQTLTTARQYKSAIGEYIDEYMLDEYTEQLSWLRDTSAVLDKLRDGEFSVRFRVKPNEQHRDFYEFHFVSVDNIGKGQIAVVGLRCVDDMAKEEQEQKRILKDALEAAQHASTAKTDFLSKMSHDIRTPMNAIIGMTAIAAAHIDNPERVRDALAKITASSRHLLGLINEVLDMSKIESGTISLNETAFNLSELINNLVMMIQPQIKEHGHELLVQIHNIEHEDVIGDSLRIQQAFVNICGNAIKYTPDGGTISISIRECPMNVSTSACYEFVFKDNGIGMSKDYLEHIFEPFTRAEDVRTSKIQGTGLGMAITQNVVHLMNGDIKVESELGVGSTFTVTIFLKLQQPHEQDTEWLQGLRVIAVDDDPDICETVCDTLNSIGMEGEGYTSGREAVEAVKHAQDEGRDFYAAILDWKMPGMDGIATAKAIKKISKFHMPIIILSAYDWSEIEMEARAAGVDAFLSKPVFRSDLIRTFSHISNRDVQEETEHESTRDSLKALEGQNYEDKTALLVEDNELNREIAEEILESTGLKVETAEDGRDAVDKFVQSQVGYYDIIFMDIQMPVMNGYDAAMAIRGLSRADAAHIPIVAMTANAFVEDVQAAKSAGMNEHIAKPIDFDKLSEVLRKYL